jgi:hypothetical protein
VIFILGGVFLDREFGTEPWLTLVGVGIAIVAAGYQLYELSTLGRSGASLGPVTRQIQRVVPSRKRGATTSEIENDRSETGIRDRE